MSEKQIWENRLKEKLSQTMVVNFAHDLHHDADGISVLCELLRTSDIRRVSYNAAWILFYLPKDDKDIYLFPFYNEIAEMVMLPDLNIRRGLILSIIADMPVTDNFRADLYDYCLNGMVDRKECHSTRSVMIKFAVKVCLAFPELKNELLETLELLSCEQQPSLVAARRNAWKELKKICKVGFNPVSSF